MFTVTGVENDECCPVNLNTVPGSHHGKDERGGAGGRKKPVIQPRHSKSISDLMNVGCHGNKPCRQIISRVISFQFLRLQKKLIN